jgi:hypothetical protein
LQFHEVSDNWECWTCTGEVEAPPTPPSEEESPPPPSTRPKRGRKPLIAINDLEVVEESLPKRAKRTPRAERTLRDSDEDVILVDSDEEPYTPRKTATKATTPPPKKPVTRGSTQSPKKPAINASTPSPTKSKKKIVEESLFIAAKAMLVSCIPEFKKMFDVQGLKKRINAVQVAEL